MPSSVRILCINFFSSKCERKFPIALDHWPTAEFTYLERAINLVKCGTPCCLISEGHLFSNKFWWILNPMVLNGAFASGGKIPSLRFVLNLMQKASYDHFAFVGDIKKANNWVYISFVQRELPNLFNIKLQALVLSSEQMGYPILANMTIFQPSCITSLLGRTMWDLLTTIWSMFCWKSVIWM